MTATHRLSVFEELRGRYREVVEALLTEAGVEFPVRRGDSYAVRCPWHDDDRPSLVVIPNAGLVQCKSNCGDLTLWELVVRLGHAHSKREAAAYLRSRFLNGTAVTNDNGKPTATPRAERRAKDFDAWCRSSRVDWLNLGENDQRGRLAKGAGYSLRALAELEVGFAAAKTIRGERYPPSLLFAAHQRVGEPAVGVVLRALELGAEPKSRTVGRGRSLLGVDQLVKKPDALVVITEGEKDMVRGLAALPDVAWLSVASGCGTNITPAASVLENREVILLFDMERAARDGSLARAGEVAAHASSVAVATIPRDVLAGTKDEKDVADLVRKYGGGAPALLRRIIDAAEPFETTAEPAFDPLQDRRHLALVPGEHRLPSGESRTVSEAAFAADVLEHLPQGVLYRRETVVGELLGVCGSVRFVPLSLDRARLAISRVVVFGRWKQRKAETPVLSVVVCNRDLAGLVLAAAQSSTSVRSLRLLTSYPVFVGSEMTLVRPGWNADAGTYYDEPETLRGLEPARVEPGHVPDVLSDLYIDFPFRDRASFQNAVGMLLTPLIRPALRPSTTPLHLLLAPIERVGKSKIAEQVLGGVVLGHSTPAQQLGGSAAEQDKRIIALLLEGGTIVHFDNLVGDLDSPALASLLTAETYAGRVLGLSLMTRQPNTLTIIGSGNNVKATGEIAKRSVPIWLDPKDEAPEDRTDFRHPDLPFFVASVRREVLAALIGMVETWKAAGRPDADRRLGGFEHWAAVVGGVLRLFGCRDWLANYRGFIRAADTEGHDLRALVTAWLSTHGGAPMRATELLRLVVNTDLFPRIQAKKEGRAQATAFGRLLGRNVGVIVGSHKIAVETSGRTTRYRLDTTDVPPSGAAQQ